MVGISELSPFGRLFLSDGDGDGDGDCNLNLVVGISVFATALRAPGSASAVLRAFFLKRRLQGPVPTASGTPATLGGG